MRVPPPAAFGYLCPWVAGSKPRRAMPNLPHSEPAAPAPGEPPAVTDPRPRGLSPHPAHTLVPSTLRRRPQPLARARAPPVTLLFPSHFCFELIARIPHAWPPCTAFFASSGCVAALRPARRCGGCRLAPRRGDPCFRPRARSPPPHRTHSTSRAALRRPRQAMRQRAGGGRGCAGRHCIWPPHIPTPISACLPARANPTHHRR